MASTINPNLPTTSSAIDSSVMRGQFGAAVTDINALQAADTAINTALNGKQATLVSGTNIKTVDGQSLLGAGDIVTGGGGGGSGTVASGTVGQLAIYTGATTVGGTAFKTVGGTSIIGAGDIPVTGGGGGVVNTINTNAPLTGGASAATVTLGLTAGTVNGQVLTWNGTAWNAAASTGGIVNTINTTAPLTGGASTATVTIGLTAGTANGQVLTWNGSAWGAQAGGTGGVVNQINTNAPLTGGASAATVTLGLTNGTIANQVLTWNGTSWGAALPTGGALTPPVQLATNASPQAIAAPVLFQIAALDNTNTTQVIDAAGTGLPILELRKMGGTMVAAAVPGTGQNLGNLRVTGLTAAPGTFGSGFEIQVSTSATAWTAASQGTVVGFWSGRDGSAGRLRSFYINANGGLVVGAPSNLNQAAGSINAQTIWVNGVELSAWIEDRYGLTPI